MNPLKKKTEIEKLITITKRELAIIEDHLNCNKLGEPNLILYAKILRGSASEIVTILQDK